MAGVRVPPLWRGDRDRASFTKFLPSRRTMTEPECFSGRTMGYLMVAGIAIAMFIALFGWGARYFGWSDPSGKVQLALVTAFILGIVASYKSRG